MTTTAPEWQPGDPGPRPSTFTIGVFPRPMFELIEEIQMDYPNNDAARWPLPMAAHDLGEEA